MDTDIPFKCSTGNSLTNDPAEKHGSCGFDLMQGQKIKTDSPLCFPETKSRGPAPDKQTTQTPQFPLNVTNFLSRHAPIHLNSTFVLAVTVQSNQYLLKSAKITKKINFLVPFNKKYF